MATKITIFLICFVLIFAKFTHADVFSNILDDVTSCTDVCRNTFTPHTYEKSGSEDSCNRGCRLFSMMEFIYDDMNKTTEVCISSCSEAYTEIEDQEACNLGCKSQKPFAVENLLKDDPWEQHIRLVDPFSYMHSWYSSVFNGVVSQASVSWTMYMRDGDGSVLIVKSPSQFKHVDFMEKSGSSEEDDMFNTASYIETNIEPIDNSATPFLKNTYQSHRNDNDLLDLSKRDQGSRFSHHDDHGDWLSCIAKKTGLPRLLLSMLLLMCAIAMIWLCLSAAVTSPEQKVVTEPKKLSINGDQEVIEALLSQGVKPVYPLQKKQDLKYLPIKISVHRI